MKKEDISFTQGKRILSNTCFFLIVHLKNHTKREIIECEILINLYDSRSFN